jgi:hypothetical protein
MTEPPPKHRPERRKLLDGSRCPRDTMRQFLTPSPGRSSTQSTSTGTYRIFRQLTVRAQLDALYFVSCVRMTASGAKRPFRSVRVTSAFGGSADVAGGRSGRRERPEAAIKATAPCRRYRNLYPGLEDAVAVQWTARLVVLPRRGLHIEQRTYDIDTGTGFSELSVILSSPENFTSYATSETATPSEHDAITCIFDPSLCSDLTAHF